ncbi:MAG TPA: acetyl-CoA carboxylase biotin carboxylase subunit [Longimicrobiales bacterium]|nr:acetyl-CoA carboxylase biotin carboxylase subunit [Longimicrobiales bacterium]
MLKKVLVANRGEIAVRIIRACRELGITSVAVYSDADSTAPHVLLADEAYFIGPAPSAQSYLRADVLIDVARRSGCDAVHPGYGFLAERAHFAQAVVDAGLIFVGPPPSAIAAMGDKTEARRRMEGAGVPLVPGTTAHAKDAKDASDSAAQIGYPVLLKAAAGGGGKGMRVVERAEDLARAFESASNEAKNAFGDGSVYLEKYLSGPRHIEIQVLADAHGNVVHLGERECSIQRRHQKMIEEAPSSVLTADVRAAMGAAAVAAASAVNYQNAGTIEFLYQDGAFYFLEMNTRIQVEHPVTELVTGIDLVQWQLRVAGGEKLPFTQDDVRLQGHAIECRITSEDPAHNFMPSTGTITMLAVPAGPQVRWDSGIQEGSEVSLYYDPMLAKLIVHAPTRAAAIDRMARALRELNIVGVDTSAPFHLRVLGEEDFREGNIDIRYLDKHPELMRGEPAEATARVAAVVAALLEEEDRQRRAVRRIGETESTTSQAWRTRGWT